MRRLGRLQCLHKLPVRIEEDSTQLPPFLGLHVGEVVQCLEKPAHNIRVDLGVSFLLGGLFNYLGWILYSMGIGSFGSF
ncbi:hypothetical protein, partial [Thermogutta sp.]|uniref:hypothetical protein n=1 Tax=Thermogutta sp. TaxID=1962930 RepID=UPI0025FC2FED